MNDESRYEFAVAAQDFKSKLGVVADFLSQFPDQAPKLKGNPKFPSYEYWIALSEKFVQGREPKAPAKPSTVPDDMVPVVLEEYFGVSADLLADITHTHSLSMAAEGIIGDLLERYIASVLEPLGWIWCSGSVVRSVDFIFRHDGDPISYVALQVKNRDNSENSSSASVRDGTAIVKWHRTFSRSGNTNWPAFPHDHVAVELTEADFKTFSKDYLSKIKPAIEDAELGD